MLSDAEQLTATQLNNLTQWFGPTVFTKSAKSSHLVVDQNLNYIRITTTGTETVDDEIYLHEGNIATLSATKFTLSETDALEYDWSIQVGQNQESVGISRVNSVRLVSGDDGSQRLIADADGTYGDYYITVTARQGGINYTLNIKIIGVILPENIQINTAIIQGNSPRRFYLNDDIRTQMSQFASATYDENNPISPGVYNFRDSYVMFSVGQTAEFYPTKVDGVIPSEVKITSCTYRLQGQAINNETELGDGFLYYAVNGSHGGITLRVGSLPANLTIYTLTIDVVVGSTKHFTRNVNIILYDDAVVMHQYATSPGVQGILNTKHTALYGNNIDNYYKSDLLSLTGQLDFTTNIQGVGTVNAADGNSLLKYLSNITSLDFSGCSSLSASSLGAVNNGVLTFEAMPYLTTVNLSSTPTTYTVDFSNCPNLTTVNMQNTSAGIILTQGSKVTSMQLGSPTYISIDSPATLGNTGTMFTVQSSANLTTLLLNGVNQSTTRGYGMFNSLYNPS